MVLVKKVSDSIQCIKVCSIESEFGHKEHVSSLIRLYFFNSFLDGVILCRTLKENCPSLLSLGADYMRRAGPLSRAGSVCQDLGTSVKHTKNQLCDYMEKFQPG